MSIRKIIADQIDQSRSAIAARGWDAARYVRHYVSEDDRNSLSNNSIKGVPPHIARTRKLVINEVEIRALEVLGPEGEKS